MNARQSVVDFSDRRWPDLGSAAPAIDMRDDDDFEPPLHPSEAGRRGLGRLLPGRRVIIAFALGIAATLAWQTWGNEPRRALADKFPQLAWLAPRAAADGAAAPSDQITSITRSLAVVRQDVDRVSAEVAKLQAVKPETTVLRTTAAPPPPPSPPPSSSRKTTSAPRAAQGATTQ